MWVTLGLVLRRDRIAALVGFGLSIAALVVACAVGAGTLLWSAISICALLILPGLAVLSTLTPAWDHDAAEAVTLSVGLSLAVLPLLLAWMTWLGGKWTPGLVAGLLTVCAAVTWAAWRWRRVPAGARLSFDAPTALLLLAIFALTLGLRLDHIRGVLMPAWSDSFQHVMVSKLIITGGQVPADYGPLIEIGSFRYHFGFHALVAFWAWLTGMAPHVAVLWTGQVVNALSPLTVYFLLAYGLRNRRAGVVGALVVGLLTISPANHVNFGRYPQLAGQLLLPVPMALTIRSLWAEDSEPRPWKMAAVSAAGLCLTHYRVTLFYACFVLANLLVLAWAHGRNRLWLWRSLLDAGRLAGLAVLMVAPWLVHLALALGQRLQRSAAIDTSDQQHFVSWQFVVTWSVTAPLVIGSMLGAAWAFIRRNGRVAALVVWVALLFVLANPRLFRLPTSMVNNGAVVLALYLPVGVLVGYLASEVLRGLELRWGGRAATFGLVAIVLVGSISGARTLNRRILEPWRFFVTPDDLLAYAWIRDNVPADAIFAVQEYHEMGPLMVHGVDAGLWIPYMTGHRTTMPPMPYNGELSPEAADAINRRAFDTRRLPSDREALTRLRAEGVTHVYVVQPRIYWLENVWQPEAFLVEPAYRLVYHHGTVWIFAVDLSAKEGWSRTGHGATT